MNEFRDLEVHLADRVDLTEFYNHEKQFLNDQEKQAISPLLHDFNNLEKRYINKRFLNQGGEKKIYRVFDTSSDRYVAMARSLHNNLPSEKEKFLRISFGNTIKTQ